ncbi:hypothetical protein GCM10022222_39490 [Amycolatopsis ultiminotia]|uniref:Uncharacterized protein n=1 Tax=Amycolatopsis ultiminotia TaxID=543629 RepID=A0ABP6WI27_9PSEU
MRWLATGEVEEGVSVTVVAPAWVESLCGQDPSPCTEPGEAGERRSETVMKFLQWDPIGGYIDLEVHVHQVLRRLATIKWIHC